MPVKKLPYTSNQIYINAIHAAKNDSIILTNKNSPDRDSNNYNTTDGILCCMQIFSRPEIIRLVEKNLKHSKGFIFYHAVEKKKRNI